MKRILAFFAAIALFAACTDPEPQTQISEEGAVPTEQTQETTVDSASTETLQVTDGGN